MQIITASEARANLYRLIDETAESHQPIAITGKQTNAVLLSAEDWSAIQETLYLLRLVVCTIADYKAAIHFNTQTVYIRAVFTYKEYDLWKP